MANKTIKTLKALKKILKKTLPEKISKVLSSYEKFSTQCEPEDAKSFSAYHTALKSAIVHAETLLKLAKWSEPEEKNSPIFEDLELIKFLKEAEDLKLQERENEEDEG